MVAARTKVQKLGRAGMNGRAYSLNLLEITESVVDICAAIAKQKEKANSGRVVKKSLY